MCCTTMTAKRVSAGNAGTRCPSATGPPVETATTHSRGSIPPDTAAPDEEGRGAGAAAGAAPRADSGARNEPGAALELGGLPAPAPGEAGAAAAVFGAAGAAAAVLGAARGLDAAA